MRQPEKSKSGALVQNDPTNDPKKSQLQLPKGTCKINTAVDDLKHPFKDQSLHWNDFKNDKHIFQVTNHPPKWVSPFFFGFQTTKHFSFDFTKPSKSQEQVPLFVGGDSSGGGTTMSLVLTLAERRSAPWSPGHVFSMFFFCENIYQFWGEKTGRRCCVFS